MTAAAKSGFVLVLAVLLLLGPAGLCASCFKAPAAPVHPCCPKPVPGPSDCSKTGGCAYAAAVHAVKTSVVDQPTDWVAPVIDQAHLLPLQTHVSAPVEIAFINAPNRFLTCHQFLI